MSKYVLFSPIGKTDPITNEYDGPFLHICRIYKPDVIVFYLTQDMYKWHIKDNRYIYCLNKLMEKDGFKTEILFENREDLTDAHIFGNFYTDYRSILEMLHNEYPDYELLLNISSGTPQMIADLYTLAVFLPFPVTLIQTATPARRVNKGNNNDRKTYDVKDCWDTDIDNEDEGFENRCIAVQTQNLNAEIQKVNIRRMLKSYDYAAAFEIAEQIEALISPKAIELLKAAKMRAELNALNIPSEEIKKQFGVFGSNQNHRIEIAEYLLWLDMKMKRGDNADFLRGLTPALFALMKIAVEEKGGFKISEKCCDKDLKFDSAKLNSVAEGKELQTILKKDSSRFGKYLLSSHYNAVIEEKFPLRHWADPLKLLRKVEEKVRHPLAHTITRIDSEWIKKKLNESEKLKKAGVYSVEKVNNLIKQAVDQLNKDTKRSNSTILSVDWQAYDKMNDEITEALNLNVE